jgi:uncharacterized protein (DUF1697 family)
LDTAATRPDYENERYRVMSALVVLLRSVNVGGTTKMAMSDVRRLSEDAGFEQVRTYIQSGNIVLSSRFSKAKTREVFERALAAKFGKPIGVHLRSPAELEAILERNPFTDAAPNRVLVFLLDRPAPKDTLSTLKIPGREQVHVSGREIYVHYPDGIGPSMLKIRAAATATSRNVNTLRKLLELARSYG